MGLGDMLIKGTIYAVENREKIQDKVDKTRDVMGEIGETQRNIAKVGKGIIEVAGNQKVKGSINVTVGAVKGKKSGEKVKKGLRAFFGK